MQTKFKLALVTAACAVTTGAFAQVTLDGALEINNTKSTGSAFSMDGFGEANLNGMVKKGDYFASGKVSLRQTLGTTNTLAVRDAWVKLGSSAADFQLGRFEAADLFPTNDVFVASTTLSTGYKTNKLRGRVATGQFHGVAGLNASGGLRLELGVVSAGTGGSNEHGIRPTVVYTSGPLTLRGGIEAIKQTGVASSTGVGLSAGYAFMTDGNVNVNYGRNSKKDLASLGVDVKIGGAVVGLWHDTGTGVTANTLYASYTFSDVMGLKGLAITPGLSHATGTGVSSVNQVGVRVGYTF